MQDRLGEKMVQIYGTLGPACADQQVLERMFAAGLTGMRLNLSHTGLKESAGIVENFRRAAESAGIVPQLLIDMQGPELRVGALEGVLELEDGQHVVLMASEADSQAMMLTDSEVTEDQTKMQSSSEADVQTATGDVHEVWARIPVQAAVLAALACGDEVLLNDGKIALRAEQATAAEALCLVTRGGQLSGHKSVKIVGKQVDMPVLTAHDIANIRLAREYGVTGLMQPFVRSGQDLARVREQLQENDAAQVQIFAKIESRNALEKLDDILKEADVIIIARGDLGNDMELWELPAVQKDIETACKKAGKPFIVVTQMLASMESCPVPTRAEVSDIFNAVADGAYGVMITGESAVGKYPVEAVKYLANTARSAETWMTKA